MTNNRLSILGCFAHPDDEGLVTGAFAKYIEEGARTALVCATRGEVGEIAPGVDATKETLGQVRERELRDAMAHINLDEIYFLDYRDSGMDGTAENQDPRAFLNAPDDEVIGQLVRIIRTTKPQVLVTFDPSGGYGHPDHKKIHHATMRAFDLAGDPEAYAEQLANGLGPHTPLKVYWTGFSREFFEEVARYLKEQGMDLSQFGPFNPETRRSMLEHEITTQVPVAAYVELKERAWAAHATQQNPSGVLAKLPRDLWRKFRMTEHFVLAKTRAPRHDGIIEDDLFAGVRG